MEVREQKRQIESNLGMEKVPRTLRIPNKLQNCMFLLTEIRSERLTFWPGAVYRQEKKCKFRDEKEKVEWLSNRLSLERNILNYKITPFERPDVVCTGISEHIQNTKNFHIPHEPVS